MASRLDEMTRGACAPLLAPAETDAEAVALMEAVADSETDATTTKGLVELRAEEEMMLELLLLEEGATHTEVEEEAGGGDHDDEEGGGLQVDEGDGSTHWEVEDEGGGTQTEVEVVGGGGGGVQVEVGVGVGVGEGDGSWGACPSNHQVMARTPAPSSANWVKSWMSVVFRVMMVVSAYSWSQTDSQLCIGMKSEEDSL